MHHHHFKDHFITFAHYFQLFLYYARECSIIPKLFSLKLQPTYYSQNYAGILGSGLALCL